MSEIKSAVELALEKTKGLDPSREEKARWKEEELEHKAQGLANRFLEVDFHLREVEKELSKYEPDQRAPLETLLVQYLAEAIHLDRDNSLTFQGIEFLRQGSKPTLRKTAELVERYHGVKEQEYRKTEKELLAKLERLAISGSAVRPKVEGSREWQEAQARFQPPLEEQLRTLKEDLR